MGAFRRVRLLITAFLLGVLFVGPELSARTAPAPGASSPAACDQGPIDPTPEKLDGTPSQEFEPEDVRAARTAPCVVVLYCQGVESEAQYVGCLSHVTVADVCQQNTAARRAAVAKSGESCGNRGPRKRNAANPVASTETEDEGTDFGKLGLLLLLTVGPIVILSGLYGIIRDL
jgi:hypothetical protein